MSHGKTTGSVGSPGSPSPVWYAAMSRLLIAAVSGIYPAPRARRSRDLVLVREMLHLAETSLTPEVIAEGEEQA